MRLRFSLASLLSVLTMFLLVEVKARVVVPDPRDSLVVIHNPLLSYNYCLGVVTGEKEVMTPADCVASGSHSVTVCTDLLNCLQTAENSSDRLGVQPVYQARLDSGPANENVKIVKLILEEAIPGKVIAEVYPDKPECESMLDCFILLQTDEQFEWQSRQMNVSCDEPVEHDEFYAVHAEDIEHFDGTYITGAALFDRMSRLVGMAFDNGMFYRFNQDKPVLFGQASHGRVVHHYPRYNQTEFLAAFPEL